MEANQKKTEDSIFTCKVEIVLSVPADQATAPFLKEVSYDLRLPSPGRLNPEAYLDKKDLLTAAGVKMVANSLIQGLAANVQAAESMGLWEPSEHIEWLHPELRRALTNNGKFVSSDEKFRTPG